MDEKISILIPTYNREKYIAEALKSAQKQTYSNIQILVYDDGSSDSTVPIVKKFCSEDSRIRLFEGKENKGVPYARNRLLELCDTKYACWLDSDDILNIHRVAIQYEFIKERESIVFCAASRFSDSLDKKVWTSYPSSKVLKPCEVQISAMFPVEKAVRYDEGKVTGGEDVSWNIQMMKILPALSVTKILYYIRVHADRISCWRRKVKVLPEHLKRGRSYEQILNTYKKGTKLCG